MGEQIALKTQDGHDVGAYRCAPSGRPRGGVVVVQEAFGVNAYVRSVVDRYAEQGYLAIAPALYDRQRRGAELGYEGDDLNTARNLRRALKWDEVLNDVAAAVRDANAAGKVGIVGFCVGGSVAWLAAQHLPVSAAVSYYGRDIVDFLSDPPRCPTMLHYADHDHHISPADVEKVRTAFPELPIYVYPGEHGFDCPTRAIFHAESARIAGARTLALFRKFVG